MEMGVADLAVRGTVQTGSGAWQRGEVLIDAGRIRGVTEDVGSVDSRRCIDVGAAYVLPGVVDAHVHCLSHPGEGVAAATAAAAAGGVTTIVEMPFDQAGPINSVDRFKRKHDLVEDEALVDVAMLATVAPDGGWRAAEALTDAGACGFKVSLFDTDPHRFPRIDDAELLNVMAATAGAARPLCVHAENTEVIKTLIEVERLRDPRDPHAHARSRPPVSETLGVLTALEVAHTQNARLHLCHLSTPRAVDLVRWFADDGLDVTVETCPHYLTFTDDDMDSHRGRLKINPPLRSSQARAGMWERLASGAVDVVASDHAPWPTQYKDQELIFDNRSGVPGVETLVAATLSGALDQGVQMFARAIEALTLTPARRFGLDHRKGRIAEGYDADLAVFDPAQSWDVDQELLHSNAGWSPYHARAFRGRVVLTVSNGAVVWDGTSLTGEAGRAGVIKPRG